MADRTYPMTLKDGHKVVMGPLSGREVVDMRNGRMREDAILELVAGRMVSHDYDGVTDPLDLDVAVLLEVVNGWGEAIKDAALPPANGSR